ncbi:uncharacterized protein LOC136029918 [Artemia franciscana]|uniref:uncharacterized protein LOC136029918 n=1 Tax=Artemia franciscana TaxID=6661 RepID=UPI0032DA053B
MKHSIIFNRLHTYIWSKPKHTSFLRSISRLALDKNVTRSELPDCELPRVSLTQYLFEQTDKFGSKVALECATTGKTYTYRQVRQLSVRFGASLTKMGLRKGDILGLVLPNCPEWSFILLGAAYVGVIVTPVNPTYTAGEIIRQFNAAEVRAVLCDISYVSMLKPKLNNIHSSNVFITIFGHSEGCITFEDLISTDLYTDEATIDPENDTLILPYSSGTTGLPKGVILSHSNIVYNLCQIHAPATTQVRTAIGEYQERPVCILPYFHIYGLQTLLSGLWHGSHQTILSKFEPGSFLSTLNSVKPTMLQLVPPLISYLGNEKKLNLKAFERMHTIMSGAAPLGPATANKLLEKLRNPGITLQEGYGLTETSPVTHLSPLQNAEIGSCGKPVSRTEVKVVDLETGNALGPNEEGELCVKGPQIMKGYFKNPAATTNMIDDDGWLHTGDVAKYDAEKRFYIVDRLKELIKVKGLQVAPSELEDLLRSHPQIDDVAVIGVPDERTGEAPKAYVVVKPGAGLSEKNIADFVAQKVAPHKQLRGGVVIASSIPKSASGKILRRELRSNI